MYTDRRSSSLSKPFTASTVVWGAITPISSPPPDRASNPFFTASDTCAGDPMMTSRRALGA
eukprot:CAMPEP_0173413478 /NCGR_PEP_ID=MMETSP1356-20130122/82171_1 /TAXON_ID=77927 ORGANISM="Hemiselmis virescens, Strain PCC157" /NCGR_SAMPLE_ID=MMETSP1356 /ASSEMBLY_ACC=CAM_ASM_000847 /LENGTH=60 /DNA_ID=CAMNT_0014375527 /DNA_START=201 /DNA_END=383 /DNA_ORIENTATION=-